MVVEPKEYVDQELELIEKVQECGQALLELKAEHNQNIKAVRAWRTNNPRRIEKLLEAHTGVLNEDEYQTINAQINALNHEINALGGKEYTDVNSAGRDARNCARKMLELKKKLDELGLETSNLEITKNALLERKNSVNQSLKEQKKRIKSIEEFNAETEKENKRQENLIAQYQAELEEYVKNINQVMNGIVEGNWAIIDDQGELEMYSPEEIAWELGANIAENSRFIENLPDEFYNYMNDWFLDNPENENNAQAISQELLTLFNQLLNCVGEEPERPVINSFQFQSVPEIEPQKMNVRNLEIEKLSHDIILQGQKIPPSIIDELKSYTVGKFENTLRHAERINEIAKQFDTLPINAVDESNQREIERELRRLIRQLTDIFNSFGNERNSRVGKQRIDNLVSATDMLLNHTRNQRSFEQYLNGFLNASDVLKTWINASWWQYGGQPENHHSAGRGDHSQSVRSSNYVGPSLKDM